MASAHEETIRVWKSIGVWDGHAIWIPSREFVAQLKAQGTITSGSISHEAWQAAQGAVDALFDWAKYAAGFVVGALEGAYGSVRDLVMGVADFAEMIFDVAKAIIQEGFVEACQSFGEKIVTFFKDAPQALETLGVWFAEKWTAEDAWERGLFQGEVIGYVAMMIVITILTMGGGAAVQTSGKFGQVVRLVRTLDAAGDIFTYAGKLRRVVRIPDKVKDALGRSGRARRKIPEHAGPGGAGRPVAPDGGPGSQAAHADGDVGRSPPVGAMGRTVAEYPVRLASRLHKVRLQDVGGAMQIWLCSDCGRMLRKVEKVLERIPDKGPEKSLRKRLVRLRDKITDAETRLKNGKLPREYLHRELGQISAHLRDLSRRYPEFDELCFFENFKPKKLEPKKVNRDVPADIRAMMLSQKRSPPDMVDKGVHFNVGKFELKVQADESGKLALRKVFTRQEGPALKAAIRKGEKALENEAFRKWLREAAEMGRTLAEQEDKAQKVQDFNRLIQALEQGNKQ